MDTILVIKLSALGDLVMASGCFAAIRRHHARDRIVLLTTAPYAGMFAGSGLFDEVVVDRRPKAWQLGTWWALARTLRRYRFRRVYDLQRKLRTELLYWALGMGRPGLEWSGVAPGASHRVPDGRNVSRHMVDKLAEQLNAAGIAEVPPPAVPWLKGGSIVADLPQPFAVLVVGTAPTRPEKLAPTTLYVQIAEWLLRRGITPVLVGTASDAPYVAAVLRGCPGALDLCGRTSFADLADLGRCAVVAVGNDTGPMHLLSVAGCPVVVLFSHGSDPERIRPCGPVVEVLRRPDLATLRLAEVGTAIERAMGERTVDVSSR